MNYDDYIKFKQKTAQNYGFEPLPFTAPLFDWQKQIVSWAVANMRSVEAQPTLF
jgi:hypothetical protein